MYKEKSSYLKFSALTGTCLNEVSKEMVFGPFFGSRDIEYFQGRMNSVFAKLPESLRAKMKLEFEDFWLGRPDNALAFLLAKTSATRRLKVTPPEKKLYHRRWYKNLFSFFGEESFPRYAYACLYEGRSDQRLKGQVFGPFDSQEDLRMWEENLRSAMERRKSKFEPEIKTYPIIYPNSTECRDLVCEITRMAKNAVAGSRYPIFIGGMTFFSRDAK